MTRLLAHRLFAPALLSAIFAVGALMVLFLLVGPGLGAWADTLLTACFGWDAATRRYRLDGLLLALAQPPLFGAVVYVFYRDEVRACARSRGGRLATALGPLVFLALATTLLGTSEISASGAPPSAATLPAPLRQGAPAPPFVLTDHRGQSLALEALRGRPVAMTFVYADCHESCPLLLARLKALEARPGAEEVAFLAVSLDPERDTPARLAAAAAHWGLGSRWHLLGGAPAAVHAVLGAYGVGWARLPSGEVAHENVVILIDRQGRLAFTYRGLAQPEDRQAADLARLLGERG